MLSVKIIPPMMFRSGMVRAIVSLSNTDGMVKNLSQNPIDGSMRAR